MVATMDRVSRAGTLSTEACPDEDIWDRVRRIFHAVGFMYAVAMLS